MNKILIIILFIVFTPIKSYSSLFNNLSIHFNVFGKCSLNMSGELISEEYDTEEMSYTYSDGETKDGRLEHYSYSYGFFIDFMAKDEDISEDKKKNEISESPDKKGEGLEKTASAESNNKQ